MARALVIAVVVAGCYHAADTSRDGADAPAAGSGIDAALGDAPMTNLDWTWTFGGAATCPSGVDRVEIFTAQWNTDSIDYRQEPTAPTTFPCAAGGGAVVVPDGFDYDSWIVVLTTDDRVYAVTGPGHVDLGTTATADVALPRGWVHVAWSLYGQHSQGALACTDVPSLTGSGTGVIDLFSGSAAQTTPMDAAPCGANDTWLAMPAGSYDLTLRAVYSQKYLPANGPDAFLLGETTLADQTVTADQTLELGSQQLPLTQY
ncbi:MAG TPA: hypothetical protein VGL61_26480 [Kofleriaceae bacterium]